MSPETLRDIRRMYAEIDVTEYNPYPMDWVMLFTPIERMVWGNIRNFGLPFWPQFAIGHYFADFADPIKKIVIECDGEAYHTDKGRDRMRDAFMGRRGWTVFRIPGHMCARILPSPAEIYDEMDGRELGASETKEIEDWYRTTSDGLIASLAYAYYGVKPFSRDEDYNNLVEKLIEEVVGQRKSGLFAYGDRH